MKSRLPSNKTDTQSRWYKKMRRLNPIVFFLIFIFALLAELLSLSRSVDASQTDWTANQAMLLYFEAFTQIKARDMTRPKDRQIVEQSIRGYLRHLDPYCDYLTAKEYDAFLKTQKSQYIGLGVDIERNAQGETVCYPYPGSPAAQAGIERGAVLQAIEGKDITGKSLFTIGAMLLGQEGQEVNLAIRNPDQPERILKVRRRAIETDSVIVETQNDLVIIKILNFRADTPRQLSGILARRRDSKPMIIDLRDNPGGDLYRSIDCAMLFLKKDQTIVTIEKASETKVFKSTTDAVDSSSPVYIWCNEQTASAGEVFMAALTQNGRAVSIGQQTYGKGVTQDIVQLSDGSVMILTSGLLVTAGGQRYHQTGLSPDYLLTESAPNTNDYLEKTQQLIQKIRFAPKAATDTKLSDDRSTSSNQLSPDPTPTIAGVDRPTENHPSAPLAPKPKIDIAVPPPEIHLVCFHDEFGSVIDAESWAMEIVNSYNDLKDFLLLSVNDTYHVCAGPFPTRQQALDYGHILSQKTGNSAFYKLLKQDDNYDNSSLKNIYHENH